MDHGSSHTKLDPFDPDFYADMHTRLRQLRASDPVHFIEPLRIWCTTTYSDSATVFRDPRFVKRGWVEMVDKSFGGNTILGDFLFFKDPPEHTRLRRLVQKNMRHSTAAALIERSDAVVTALVGELRRAGGWRSRTGLRMANPNTGDRCTLRRARHRCRHDRRMGPRPVPGDRYDPARLSARRATRPERDVRLLRSAHSEIADQRRRVHLVIGGYDTTAHQIASGAYLLLTNPAALAQLRADWSLLDNTVEEILRCEPSAPLLGREAAVDLTIHGKEIKAGDFIGPLVAAANRDPERFDDPDSFQIAPSRPAHLSFGIGSRRCLGEHLARVNIKTAMRQLFSDDVGLTLDDHTPTWRSSLLFRGLAGLPVTVG
ncbi:cytochrome P450 [Nocardia sp. NPDC052566]|uniref:cytochrome P450 n=1 Tax=Nocardia sp. NPDC052566 TaxID=3364330 RepID=UPI0037CCB9C0